jgi:hypothetical protein
MYTSPNITTMNKSRRMRWEERVPHMVKSAMRRGFCWINVKERDHLQALSVDWWMLLKWR